MNCMSTDTGALGSLLQIKYIEPDTTYFFYYPDSICKTLSGGDMFYVFVSAPKPDFTFDIVLILCLLYVWVAAVLKWRLSR